MNIIWRDSLVYYDMTHSCYMACLINAWEMNLYTYAMTHVKGLIHLCDVTHLCKWHDAFILYDVTHYGMRNDPSIHMTWRIHVRDMTHSHIWRDSCMYVTWFIHTYDMTHSHTWHDSFTYMTSLIDVLAITHQYLYHDALICSNLFFLNEDFMIFVTWLVNVCETTHWFLWHNALLYERWLIHKWVLSHIYELCLYMNASCHEN